MRKYGVALLLSLVCSLSAQLPYKYRVFLTDKQQNATLLSTPEVLLSEKALARRVHHEVFVDTTDLPVSATYIARLAEAGFPFVCASRWFNSVVVASADSDAIEALRGLPFVSDAKLVWKDNKVQPSFFVKEDVVGKKERRAEVAALAQLTVHHGEMLHKEGYRGDGMLIAVIDAGFLNADKIAAFEGKIAGTRDFVNPEIDIFATDPHGTNVLSVMATPASDEFSGTAPNATYWLLRSEDGSSEYPVEEDYWIAAAEYADSLGVDIINSSLGYSLFDDPQMNYTLSDIDGKSAFITRGASMAASKGMLVINSAGNEGQKPWRMLTFPADSPDVLTVGAVTPTLQVAGFSSHGFVSKGYVKPDIAGIGAPAFILDDSGELVSAQGTSFSTPAITGLAACLWQSLPNLKNRDLIRLMHEYGSFATQPDSLRGYGLPDVYQAFSQTTPLNPAKQTTMQLIPVDTLSGIWRLTGFPETEAEGMLRLFDPTGQAKAYFSFQGNNPLFDLNHLEKGLYIMCVEAPTIRFTQQIHLHGK
ncbi:MAG: S8 family serine peptidase [Bacteroidales bacterium]